LKILDEAPQQESEEPKEVSQCLELVLSFRPSSLVSADQKVPYAMLHFNNDDFFANPFDDIKIGEKMA